MNDRMKQVIGSILVLLLAPVFLMVVLHERMQDDKIDAIEPAITNPQPFGGSSNLPSVVALFETSLAAKISSTATSFTLVSATDKDGNTLASSTYPFIIDEGTANEEFVIADCTATACTNATRGISVLTGTSSVTALKKAHGRGASVKITDGPILLIHNRLLKGIDSFPGLLSYSSGVVCTSASPAGTVCDINYIRNISAAGGATSTESRGGFVQLGTALQQASSTNLGADIPTVLQTKNATDTPQYGCATGYAGIAGAGCTVIAQLTGKIKQSWLNLTESFTVSGGFTSSAATNIACSVGNLLTLNGVSYRCPGSQATASSSALLNDGFGNMSWGSIPGLSVIAQDAATYSTTTTATSTEKTVALPANALTGSNKIQIEVIGHGSGANANKTYDIQFGNGSASTTIAAWNGGAQNSADHSIAVVTIQASNSSSAQIEYGTVIGGVTSYASMQNVTTYTGTGVLYLSVRQKVVNASDTTSIKGVTVTKVTSQ